MKFFILFFYFCFILSLPIEKLKSYLCFSCVMSDAAFHPWEKNKPRFEETQICIRGKTVLCPYDPRHEQIRWDDRIIAEGVTYFVTGGGYTSRGEFGNPNYAPGVIRTFYTSTAEEYERLLEARRRFAGFAGLASRTESSVFTLDDILKWGKSAMPN